MDLQLTPVDGRVSFRPPCCPRRRCREHRRASPRGYDARVHARHRDRRGRLITRFRCPTCRSTFSQRAFSPTYYLKRPELLPRVAAALVAGSAHRQIARVLGCAPSTVTRLAARIGRHAMLFSLEALAALDPTVEPIVLDHFETFEFTQDLPFGVATAVGHRSWFVYALDPAPHRRTGRATDAQRRRAAARPARPGFGGYRGSTRRTLDRLLARGRELRLISDDHPAYRAAVAARPDARRIRHVVHRNPPRGPKGAPRSPEAVARDRAMFPVDLLHGLIRHSQAAHRRETIAFGRRLNALLERLWLFVVWRNWVKLRSERRPDAVTPATELGLTDRPLRWRQVFARRRFPDRIPMTEIDRVLYRRAWTTPALPVNTAHDLKLAF